MLNWNEDPIVFRNEVETWWNQVLSQIEPSYLEDDLTKEDDSFMLITDSEVVDIKSSIMLPSGLRAYNLDWNTYVDFEQTWEYKYLTAAPELSQKDIKTLYWGFSSLFIGLGVMFLSSMFIIFLFRLLSGKWLK